MNGEIGSRSGGESERRSGEQLFWPRMKAAGGPHAGLVVPARRVAFARTRDAAKEGAKGG